MKLALIITGVLATVAAVLYFVWNPFKAAKKARAKA